MRVGLLFGPALMTVGAALCGLAPGAFATTVAGTIKTPAEEGINGRIELRLSAPGLVSDPALLLIQPPVTCAITAGQLAAGCGVRGNDTITNPADSYYCIRIFSSPGGSVLMPARAYVISGATLDIGTAMQAEGKQCR